MPLVTIGLPVYNSELFLEDCITSILNQTFIDFELIIIDDGSTDSSLNIIESFSDKRIIIINDKLNKGLPKRLNEITHIAKGNYIVRMDADDIMNNKRLATQINILQNNSSIDVLGSNAYSIDEKNKILGLRFQLNITLNSLYKVSSFIHPTIIAKKAWFKNNLYNEKLRRAQDAELWYRTKQISNFYCTSKPLLFYREFGGNYYKKYKALFFSMLSISKLFYTKFEFKNGLTWSLRSLKCIFKYFIYRFFNILDLENRIIKNRNLKMTKDQTKNSIEALRLALKQSFKKTLK